MNDMTNVRRCQFCDAVCAQWVHGERLKESGQPMTYCNQQCADAGDVRMALTPYDAFDVFAREVMKYRGSKNDDDLFFKDINFE